MYELVSPVSPRAILKYTGYLLLMIGGVMAVPVLAAIVLGELSAAAIYAASAAVTLGAGMLLIRILPEEDLLPKEAIVLAALVFPLASLINAVPLALANGFAPLDAVFESVSGLTTTGLSVAPDNVSSLFLFTRSWAQWVGGIGIVVLVLSALVRPGTSAFRLFDANVGETRLRPSVAGTARVLGSVYIGISAFAFALLFASGMPLFDAVCQTLTSVSTGGFSTRPESIAAFGGAAVPAAVAVACILGAINFALYPRILKKPRALLESLQMRYFFLFLAIGTVALILTHPGGSPEAVVSASAFQAVSALTTAGFSTVDIGGLPDTAKAVLTLLMWIGGGLGSTAGGIKIIRIIVLFRLMQLVFARFSLPSEAVTPLKVGEHIIDETRLHYLITFVLLYFGVVVVSAFIVMLHGVSMSNSVFEVSSALGTVGLSTGITGAGMPETLKAVLIFDMLLGRIEIIPFLVLFMPRTWWKRSPRSAAAGSGSISTEPVIITK